MGDNLVELVAVEDGVHSHFAILFLCLLFVPGTIAKLSPALLANNSSDFSYELNAFHDNVVLFENVALHRDGLGCDLVIASDHPHLNSGVLALENSARDFLPHNVLDAQNAEQGQSGLFDVVDAFLVLGDQIASL